MANDPDDDPIYQNLGELPQPKGGGQGPDDDGDILEVAAGLERKKRCPSQWETDDEPSCKKQHFEDSTSGAATDNQNQHLEIKEGNQSSGQYVDTEEEEDADENPEAALNVPESFRRMFELKQGKNLVMVMRKRLTETDLSTALRRLELPTHSNEFLKEEEKELLNVKREGKKFLNRLDAIFFDTKGNQLEVKVVKRVNHYGLTGSWVDVARDHNNRLAIGDCIELWAFRSGENDQLCLAIVKKEY